MLPHYVSVLISTLSPGKAIRRMGIECLKKISPWNPKFPQIGAQNDEIERTESIWAHLMMPRGDPDAGDAAVSRDGARKEDATAAGLRALFLAVAVKACAGSRRRDASRVARPTVLPVSP